MLDELLPATCHVTEQSTNNPIEADHGQLKIPTAADARTHTLRAVRVISVGHAFGQNLRRGHYELGMDVDLRPRLPAAELARTLSTQHHHSCACRHWVNATPP